MLNWKELVRRHPFVVSWAALSVLMVGVLLVAARDVPLQPSQLLSMVVATVLLAAACAWIIHWE